ncbi:MAG TPA: hypothetical protein VH501_06600 [Solirubrobacterales bacterium]|jgi:hypothetical protein
MPGSARRCVIAAMVALSTACAAVPQAGAASSAASAAGNSLTASATLDTSYDPFDPTAAISGRILATGHKYGPRHCLRDREVWAYYTAVSGQTYSTDADRPTNKKGRFTFTQIHVKYGDADINGIVPPSGGTVTYTLRATPEHAPKRRGDINESYKCRAVSTTVQVEVPPEPPT